MGSKKKKTKSLKFYGLGKQKTKKAKIRPLGDILLDLEPILEEMVDKQDLQWGDVLYLVYGWLLIHRPMAKEVYIDGSGNPEFYYGPTR